VVAVAYPLKNGLFANDSHLQLEKSFIFCKSTFIFY